MSFLNKDKKNKRERVKTKDRDHEKARKLRQKAAGEAEKREVPLYICPKLIQNLSDRLIKKQIKYQEKKLLDEKCDEKVLEFENYLACLNKEFKKRGLK